MDDSMMADEDGEMSQAQLDAEVAHECEMEYARVHRLVSLQFPRGLAQWLVCVALLVSIIAACYMLGAR